MSIIEEEEDIRLNAMGSAPVSEIENKADARTMEASRSSDRNTNLNQIGTSRPTADCIAIPRSVSFSRRLVCNTYNLGTIDK